MRFINTLVFFLGVCGWEAPLAAELIPREVLFGAPEHACLRVSPGGDAVAFVAPLDGVLNIWVQELTPQDAQPYPVTHSTRGHFTSFRWAHNNEQLLFMQDREGDENWRIHVVERDGSGTRDLTPIAGVSARIIALSSDRPDEILVGLNDRRSDLHDVWLINTRTGERQFVLKNDANMIQAFANAALEVQFAIQLQADGSRQLFQRQQEGWHTVFRWGVEDAYHTFPVLLTRDGRYLYLADSSGGDTSALFRREVRPDGIGPAELIVSHPHADFDGIVTCDPGTYVPQGAVFESDRREWVILDPAIEATWKRVRSIDPGEPYVLNRSHDGSVWSLVFTSDVGPSRFYLYDTKDDSVRFFFVSRPALLGAPLVPMETVQIRARDGLQLGAYLSRPKGATAPTPLVLHVHAGPYARDSWGYDAIHQWLANRGYAVLSVNYRGSTGYGKKFLNAGNHQWGGAMQDDLVDAVEWAVAQAIADPERVAIMGGSYGGYAALMGLARDPTLFAAGVSLVGPSNLETLLRSLPPYWKPILAEFQTRIGSLEEPDFLASISPLTYAGAIQRPLLVGQGANDPRVKRAESEQIVNKMQSLDRPVTYVLFPDEGHGFTQPENSRVFWGITESFLGQYLGGGVEPLTERELKASSAQVEAGGEWLKAE